MSPVTASLAACQAPGLAAQSRRQQQQQQRRGRAAALIVRAADVPNLSGGLTTTNSSLLGPKPNLGGSSLGGSPSLGPKLSTGRPQVSLDDVQLKSGVSERQPWDASQAGSAHPLCICAREWLLQSVSGQDAIETPASGG